MKEYDASIFPGDERACIRNERTCLVDMKAAWLFCAFLQHSKKKLSMTTKYLEKKLSWSAKRIHLLIIVTNWKSWRKETNVDEEAIKNLDVDSLEGNECRQFRRKWMSTI